MKWAGIAAVVVLVAAVLLRAGQNRVVKIEASPSGEWIGTIFRSSFSRQLYLRLYRPIEDVPGTGFTQALPDMPFTMDVSDNGTVCVGYRDGRAFWGDAKSGRWLNWHVLNSPLWRIHVASGRNEFVAAYANHACSYWNVDLDGPRCIGDCPGMPIYFREPYERIIVVAKDTAYVQRIADGALESVRVFPLSISGQHVRESTDALGRRLAVWQSGDLSGRVLVYDCADGRKLFDERRDIDVESQVDNVVVIPDGKLIAIVNSSAYVDRNVSNLRVCRIDAPTVVHDRPLPGEVIEIVYLDEERLIAFLRNNSETKVMILDAQTGSTIASQLLPTALDRLAVADDLKSFAFTKPFKELETWRLTNSEQEIESGKWFQVEKVGPK